MAMDKPTPNGDQRCPNCLTALTGPYCSSCGQRQMDLDQPFREIAGEAMESFLSFDARIFRTLWPLVRRPGYLTVEYLAGRRARYVHPFKLYFAFSVLLFLGLAFSGYSVVRVGEADEVVTGIQVDLSDEEGETNEVFDETEEPGLLGRVLGPVADLAENDPDSLSRLFVDRLAKSIIVLVPVFAALLWVLYPRRRYVGHLVFSLHLQSFSFLALLIGLLIDLPLRVAQGSGPGNGLSGLVIMVYSFLALRRVYGRGRLLTVATMMALLVGYLVALIVTMILTLTLTAFTI